MGCELYKTVGLEIERGAKVLCTRKNTLHHAKSSASDGGDPSSNVGSMAA